MSWWSPSSWSMLGLYSMILCSYWRRWVSWSSNVPFISIDIRPISYTNIKTQYKLSSIYSFQKQKKSKSNYTSILFCIHGPIMLAWLANCRLRWSLDCWRESSSWRAWSRCGTSFCTFVWIKETSNTSISANSTVVEGQKCRKLFTILPCPTCCQCSEGWWWCRDCFQPVWCHCTERFSELQSGWPG